MKKYAIRILLGLLVVLAFMLLAARFYEVPIVTTLESITYDTRLRLTMPSKIGRASCRERVCPYV